MGAARREREREEARRHAEAREEAGVIWKASKPAPSDHPYLVAKGVKPHGLRVHEGALVIPVRDGAELHSLQFIGPEGNKRFLIGGRVVGCYFSIGRPKDAAVLCICEGYATGASIHEATGYPVVLALNAGNLLPVAKAMRKRFTDLRLIVCGDDDAKTAGNPGRTKATEAAQAVGGAAAFPSFGEARPESLSDFNDLHRHVGLEAVRSGIEQAARGTAGAPPAPTFITAPNLWRMRHEPTRWAVRQILPEGVTILGGKPKTGKSWFAIGLAVAVGAGGRALGAIEVEAGPVLYLALEDTKRRLTKRLRILCGNTIPPAEQIEFLTDCLRLGSGGEEVLRTWLRDHPTARLVVIDTLPRFRPLTNSKETPYQNDYVVGEYLSRLCVEFQVSILVLGHLRKQPGDDPIDEISGTLGLVGSVDGYMVASTSNVG
ncbi:MAG: AAA family ATPase [Actinomycetota bacterium]